jgi:hypothetical protein
MFRDIAKKANQIFQEKVVGQVPVEVLMDRKQVKMVKTKEYEADDHANLTCWTYRFTFDNPARKRAFLEATKSYPPQEWDLFVRWMNDISNLNEELTIEAFCRVPPDQVGRFRYQFEQFIFQLIVRN